MLNIHNLSVKYPDNAANTFTNVSFVLNNGEALWLKGANGIGKSTLLYAIANVIPQILDAHREGNISLDGININYKLVNELIPDISLMLSNPAWELLFSSIDDEIVFALENLGLKDDDIKERLTEAKSFFLLNQWDSYQPHQMSWGWQKMLSCAVHYAIKPKVLLLDEPFNGLAVDNANIVVKWLKGFLQDGGILIVADHQTKVMGLNPKVLNLSEYVS
jgi:energy-coupling factor transport system ATP-binding protein